MTHTAVLLFALPDHLEAARKGLAGRNAVRNQRMWAAMRQLVAAKVRAAGLPLVRADHVLPPASYSTSFGEQLQTAVAATLSLGYERVIIIGNDCPDLRVADLRTAAATLAKGHPPVGYDRRGGIFLFGVDRRFSLAPANRGQLARLPWQTGRLRSALTDFLGLTYGAVVGLSTTRADWNGPADRQAGAWLTGAFAGLARRVWTLLARVARPVYSSNVFFTPVRACLPCGLRAPPVAALITPV